MKEAMPSVPKVQEKAKAMTAARILQDAESAAILNSSIVRGSIAAANTLTTWVRTSEYKAEVPIAGSLAVQRLTRIEARAIGMESWPIEESLIEELHNSTTSLRKAVWVKHPPHAESSPDLSTSNSVNNSSKSDGDDSSFQSSVSVEGVRMWEDIARCEIKGIKHTFIFWICLVLWVVAGTIVLVLLDNTRTKGEIEDFHRNVTIDLAEVARITLDLVYKTTVEKGIVPSRQVASFFLSQMTSMTSSNSLDMYKEGNERLREYRGGVQDFTQSVVEEVTTPRAYGGLCQKNQTFLMQDRFDMFANQSVVMLRTSPNDCANDASAAGVFRLVVPSFLRYSDSTMTYRRNEAHTASFYNIGFNLMVAVTYDQETLQQFCTPKNSLYGKLQVDHTPEAAASNMLSIWPTLIATAVAVLLLSIIVWMLWSSFSYHHIFFSVLIGFITSVGLATAMLVIQQYNANWLNDIIVTGTQSIVESITIAMLTAVVQELTLPRELLSVLSNGYFSGRLAAVDTINIEVDPPFMTNTVLQVDIDTIGSYRRGQYSTVTNGYALATTYIYKDGLLVLMLRELPLGVEINIDLAVPLTWGIVAGIFSFVYLRFSPLFRFRKYVLQLSYVGNCFSPQTGKRVLYFFIVAGSVSAALGVAAYGTWEFDKITQDYAQETLVLVAACLRASSVALVCNYGCGMPDFVAQLYFTQATEGNDLYPTIKVVSSDIPLPFPAREMWESSYLGAQLAMNQLQTTLINVPSFSTPLINQTWNGTQPQFVRRHMLSTSSINSSFGFIIERFPDSFGSMKLPLKVYSVGVTVMLITSCVICVTLEFLYLKIHKRHHEGRRVGVLLLMMVGTVGLTTIGFVTFGLVSRVLLKYEIKSFAYHELQFLMNSIKYRMTLVGLEKEYTNQDDLVNFLVTSAEDITMNAMQYSRRFFRLRVAREEGFRGSGLVKVYEAAWTDPVRIGSLDSGSIPVCGVANALVFSNVTGDVLYCYQEVPQNSEEISDTRRLFLVGIFSKDVWVNEPLQSIWPGFVGMSFLVGFVLTAMLIGLMAVIMRVGSRMSYTLMDDRNMMQYQSEILPPEVKIEHYISPKHRMWWVFSFCTLGAIAVYWTVFGGHLANVVHDSDAVSLVFESQSDLINSLFVNVEIYGFDYIIFPFPEATIAHLVEMIDQANSGELFYTFVTEEGLEEFQKGITEMNANVSSTNGYLRTWLECATLGYGSFASVIAMKYATLMIKNQNFALGLMNSLLESLIQLSSAHKTYDYKKAIEVLHNIATMRDLLLKLFVLDHIVVNSIVSFNPKGKETWPFPGDDQDKMIANAMAAASELGNLIDTGFAELKRELTALGVPNYVISVVDSVANFYPMAVSVDSVTNIFWNYQNSRQEELAILINATKLKLAQKEKTEQEACIVAQLPVFRRSKEVELSARKSRELREYLESGESIGGVFTTLAWQRSQSLQTAKDAGVVVFVCTVILYSVVSVSILIAFALLRKRSEMIQEELCEKEKESFHSHMEFNFTPALISSNAQGKIVYHHPGKDMGRGDWGKSVRNMNHKEGMDWHVEMNVDKTGYAEAPRRKEKVNEVGFSMEMEEVEGEPSLSRGGVRPAKREKSSILVPISLTLIFTLAPLIASFVLFIYLESAARHHESDTAVILSIQPEILSLSHELNGFLLKLDYYYVGINSLDTTLSYLNSVKTAVEQVIRGYIWENQTPQSSVVRHLRNTVEEFSTIVSEEMKMFKNIVAKVDPYYDTQSSYSRALLLSLTNENTYKSLIPVSMSSEGCALNIFSKDALATAITEAEAATSAEEFALVFQSYAALISEISKVSEAELQMWHATVVGGAKWGGERAVEFSQFSSFLGDVALIHIQSSTEASAPAAQTEIAEYFEELLEKTATHDDVIELFTDTLTPPPPSTPPKSHDAYFAAAYTSSYLTNVITLPGFSNVFAYNRNLVSVSDVLNGNRSLKDVVQEGQDLMHQLLISIDEFRKVEIGPTTRNKWIWHSEVLTEREKRLPDKLNLDFLALAFKWCCVAWCWGITITIGVAAALLFPAMR